MIPIETVRTEAFEMQFFRFGSGPNAYVILPGLSVQSVMSSAEIIAEAYASFTQDYTIYVFDRRAQLPPVYTVRDMARDTAEAILALGLHDICLFGASQGGMMAQVIAIEYPSLVKKMVLGSTTSHLRPEQEGVIREWIRLAEARDGVGLYLSFGQEIYPPQVFAQYRDTLTAAGQTVTEEEFIRFLILAKGMDGFNVTDELGRIRCPVLVMGVYEDAVLDSDATMEIAEKLDEIPGSRLFMYIGYGHAAFDTAPDYRQRIREFFGD